MNESELEEQLRSLRPAAPSAGLQDVIAREMAHVTAVTNEAVASPERETESIVTRILHGLPWAIGGAAAAVMVMIASEQPASRAIAEKAPEPRDERVSEEVTAAAREFRAETPSREILQAVEGDVIFAEQEEPTRLVRVNSLERRTWLNPHTGAQIAVELPREDLLLVPVAYQ
ncbi:MAG: hypothetical protein ACO1QR_15930 [Chthoniobacteraceae bacterium]